MVTFFFIAAGELLFAYFAQMTARYLLMGGELLTPGNIGSLSLAVFGDYFLLTLPLFLTALLTGLLVNYLQVGFLFTAEPLNPQLSRLNPVEGFKKNFSKRSLFELVKLLLKIFLVGLVVFLFIRNNLETLLLTLYQDAGGLWQTVSSLTLNMSLRIAVVFFALSLMDYLYQRYEYNQNLKMTKQEVKEEFKQSEGDPQLRGRLREQQRKIAMQRMMHDVPSATVVITNPTALAVAIRYREAEDEAPVVVAKGAALMAKRIREVAAEHGVSLVENKQVARMLYDQVEIGQEIPVELYQAVAEILALVYKLR